MSITIYTYKDPYKLNEKAELWDEIINCPYYCVAQTLVNGLRTVYGDTFQIGRVTTVRNLTDVLYEKWVSTSTVVKQHADIDNLVMNFNDDIGLNSSELDNIKQSFLFNRNEVFSSIRTMFELRIDQQSIVYEYLTPEQRFIVSLYKKILDSERSHFVLEKDFTENVIDAALVKSMTVAQVNSSASLELNYKSLDHIVIHGVHQFSPLILRAIEEIAKYKKVILLINYQSQYKNIYQTWIDIYSAFDTDIISFDGVEYQPNDKADISYEGNMLAQNMGKLICGEKYNIIVNKPYKILEFDNNTEFANYVAKVFEKAVSVNSERPMDVMNEQIYAADSSVNDILKIYFPEQFGERQFLNYPLGHFFIAVANMWDSETNGIQISDINDIRECLGAGILSEKRTGRLVSTFGKLESLFEGSNTVEEMLSRMRKVRKNLKYISDPQRSEALSHISYYSISEIEFSELEKALNDLEDIASFFYEDFEKRPNNFRSFYKKLKQYLQENIMDERELNEEFLDIIKRVLSRLAEIENIDASASFECLKSTMSIYLVQETKPGKSANWIVRNFEQIDGDVLRTSKQREKSILHFACLTDEDIDSVKQREFSWPLNSEFFEVAQNPVDWKYQVYVKSRKEYKNFKRYALIFGLEFNRGRYILSYVKRDGDKKREPYYLLKMLGIEEDRNIDRKIGKKQEHISEIQIEGGVSGKSNIYDFYRYVICKKRFLLESLIEGNTVYKDSFLLAKYFEVWLLNEIRENMQGLPYSEIIVKEKLNEKYDEVKKYFPFAVNINRIDIINSVSNRINTFKKFPILSVEDRKNMMIRELFIYKQLEDRNNYNQDVLKDKFVEVSQQKIDEILSDENLKNTVFVGNVNIWCKYCADREICVDYFANTNN